MNFNKSVKDIAAALLVLASFGWMGCGDSSTDSGQGVASEMEMIDEEAVRQVRITTDYGAMVVELSNKTPGHRDNFIELVESGFYDSLLFHRVINEFMKIGRAHV